MIRTSKRKKKQSQKRRGYMVERKIRLKFENHGWKTIRAGASLGEADIVCVRRGRCVLLQIKSTKKKRFYYYDYLKPKLEGFPFYIVVDFGYGRIRILRPKKIVSTDDGMDLKEFFKKGRVFK
jgi:hypothetical protein